MVREGNGNTCGRGAIEGGRGTDKCDLCAWNRVQFTRKNVPAVNNRFGAITVAVQAWYNPFPPGTDFKRAAT